jgi:beta-glucosidase
MKFRDETLSIEERVEDLINQLTTEEKISQLVHDSKEIKRLNIPAYNWWNEALHGVARAGTATVFPQPIALGASFNKKLVFDIADVISTEARAKYNIAQSYKDFSIYKGLTFWSPNINIYRDPRWGRGHETFGEDPVLTAALGVEFVKGLQGNDEKYLKTVATPKHYAVHSGPESLRHVLDAKVSKKDLNETYLYAFEHAVTKGRAEGIMAAYNKVNLEPCVASDTLLNKTLRNEWRFNGHVVSDCNGIIDLHTTHKVTNNFEESAALALKNGCDLNCGYTYKYLVKAYSDGLVNEIDINTALRRVLRARFKLGMFDKENPYQNLGLSDIASAKHQELSVDAIIESSVLLKNKDKILPLDKKTKIAVIGPNADDEKSILGNYHGTPLKTVTVLEGIRNYLSKEVMYSKGCEMLTVDDDCMYADSKTYFSESIEIAKSADVAVMVMGLSTKLEGEEGDATNADASGDRMHLGLPKIQEELIKEISKTETPIVLVLINGGPISLGEIENHVDGILECWYPGGLAGIGISKMLFGDKSPMGKLPITIVKSISDLPPFDDYSMRNRTYKYFSDQPLYPFGYGLTYSNIIISDVEVSHDSCVSITGQLKNSGLFTVKETVQIYLEIEEDESIHRLIAFKKFRVRKNEEIKFNMNIPLKEIYYFSEQGDVVLPERFKIKVGLHQGDKRSKELLNQPIFEQVIKYKECK